eukprot:TRINITY_DN284_c2_g1_i2.p2 TRINITY_DN284_c2_g1~~TRINITY_DN284_c2_g1_i2.p2  ORF type:complete len:290 (+),score=65.70 TRINITY_DN284_c2_g1_i2:1165-2034(+)
MFSTNYMQIELLFVLMCFGLLHRSCAAHVLAGTDDGNFDENSKRMAAHLRNAAGIFEYIAASCAPNTMSLIQEKIPEKVPQSFAALAALSLAEAQQLTVKKAILNKSSVPLVTKLMVDCRNRFANVANILKSISEGDSITPSLPLELLQPVICHYVSVNKVINEALMYKYLGSLAWNAAEHGKAVGFLKAANKTITSLDPPSSSAKSGTNGAAIVEMYNQVNNQATEIRNLLSIYEKENTTVFFDSVPSLEQLDIPAEGKSFVKSETFSLPLPLKITLSPATTEKCIVM